MDNEFENDEKSVSEDKEERENVFYADEKENQDKDEADFSEKSEFTVTHRHHCKGKKRGIKIVALALAAGLVFGAAFGAANSVVTKIANSKISIGTTKVEVSKGGSVPSDIAQIAEACMPSVVAITNRSVSDVMTFFGTYSQESTSSGSGIIIGKNDNELLIVTNYHVVANSKELSVLFSPVENELELQGNQASEKSIKDNESIPPATVKGYNSDKDLAVIAVELKKIPAKVLSEIKVAKIGDSSALRAGDRVVAIGNALGYGQSVTTGIVSAVNRKITMESASGGGTVTNSFIQTDTAINFGNSGGALLNMNGEVIGINSVKISSNGVEGMGYAIPTSDVMNIIDELMVKKTRSVVDEKQQGFLGITGANVSSELSNTYGMPVGVFVNDVTKGLAADKAGIKKGYVITKFDGYSISTIEQLQDRLRYYKTGESVEVVAKVPGGEKGYSEKTFKVVLSNREKNINKVEE